ncbi:hypothetical protein ACHAXT_009263 [Thalassiosira profunda]
MQSRRRRRPGRVLMYGGTDDATEAAAEAAQLLAKAKAIRESLETAGESSTAQSVSAKSSVVGTRQSEFSLPASLSTENAFRLYLDIGREKGTWMEPRWGASGRRIECTVDVSIERPKEEDGEATLASGEIAAGLAKAVTSKSSSLSPVYRLPTAPYARLRGGFDKMIIHEGGYCIESSSSASVSSSSTLRFCLSVTGTTDGDVSIPEGNLYFALPYFGLRTEGDASRMELSAKEGTVCVRQMGWHTGWRREESRILGVFRAVPIDKAKVRDKF